MNSHYICGSRHHTAHGVPDVLYFLPNSTDTYYHQKAINTDDLAVVENELACSQLDGTGSESYHEKILYTEYFSRITNLLGLQQPQHWKDFIALYSRIDSNEG